jgi:endonuclease/exonuclease/phosphatase (EEP) superfamily protein YafD
VIADLALLATLGVAIATAVSFVRDWRAALLAHFRPHLAAAASLCLLVGAAVDWPFTGSKVAVPLAALVVLLVNLREIVRATPRGAPGAGGPRLQLVFANLLRSNQDAERLIDWVRRERVDVLVVAEALDAWPRQLAVLGEELPFIVRSRVGDVAIYSRHEIAGEPHHFFPSIGHALAVEVAGLTVIGVHTASPEDAVHSAACDELIDMAGTYVENLRGPAVMVGDFNATPWSRPVLRLLARTGLRFGPGARIGSFPAELGGRLFPTWIGIPIDLVLAGRGAAVAQRRHGPRIGSDHWPVIAEIRYSRCLDPSDPRP